MCCLKSKFPSKFSCRFIICAVKKYFQRHRSQPSLVTWQSVTLKSRSNLALLTTQTHTSGIAKCTMKGCQNAEAHTLLPQQWHSRAASSSLIRARSLKCYMFALFLSDGVRLKVLQYGKKHQSTCNSGYDDCTAQTKIEWSQHSYYCNQIHSWCISIPNLESFNFKRWSEIHERKQQICVYCSLHRGCIQYILWI